MNGGELIGEGNYTCVYDPPIACTDDSAIPEKHVSRIVLSKSTEPDVQKEIKVALSKIDEKYIKHFNLATKICLANFKDTDLTPKCTAEHLDIAVKEGKTNLINMLTPIQDSHIIKKDGTLYREITMTNAAFKNYFHALAKMNSYAAQVFHMDAHEENMAWKGDTIVLFDWGLCWVGDKTLLENINGVKQVESSWNILGFVPTSFHRKILIKFKQWTGILNAINIFDTFGSVYPPSHKALDLSHQIFFRFWNMFSVYCTLKKIYEKAAEPEFVDEIYNSLVEYLNKLLTQTAFSVTYSDDEVVKVLPQIAKKDEENLLKEITATIHVLIDNAFKGEYEIEPALLGAILDNPDKTPKRELISRHNKTRSKKKSYRIKSMPRISRRVSRR